MPTFLRMLNVESKKLKQSYVFQIPIVFQNNQMVSNDYAQAIKADNTLTRDLNSREAGRKCKL